ncbi:hypothetical protein ACSC9U_01800 [Pseudomonas solani]|uniref:hypothetical protein n=1 Tax=Pseudomonas solani TaxID=2731552 RepID=UPI0003976682|nr:hypothetical protein L682_30505 [Pseudomonas alcaligenes OT 69]MDN4148320.1 hypothetical protein [Pseudomonas tohonis]
MEAFIIVAGIVALLAIALWRSARRTHAPRVSAEGAAQINRVALLTLLEPHLGHQLAQRLDGEARQLAMHQVAPALLLAGDRDLALGALAELTAGYRQSALEAMLENQLEQTGALAALDLLEASASPLPEAPLLSIPLMAAAGRRDQAQQLLDSVTAGQEGQVGQALSVRQNLLLAGLQRQLERPEAADRSLERARAMLSVPVQDAPADFQALLRECLAQERLDLFTELAVAPDALLANDAITLLLASNREAQALELLARPDMPLHALDWHELLRLALDSERPQLAERLLALAPEQMHLELLADLMAWHAGHADTARADALLRASGLDGSDATWLRLELAGRCTEAQPAWSAALLHQGLEAMEAVDNETDWIRLRLLALRSRLQGEEARDPARMTADLEEFDALRQQLDWDEQLDQACHLARLQHQLGLQDAALETLEKAVALWEAQEIDDPDERTWYLETLAEAAIALDQMERATALRDRLLELDGDSRGLDATLLRQHIDQGRYPQAIALLDLRSLMAPENPLARLRQAIERLRPEAPQRADELQRELLDALANGALGT